MRGEVCRLDDAAAGRLHRRAAGAPGRYYARRLLTSLVMSMLLRTLSLVLSVFRASRAS